MKAQIPISGDDEATAYVRCVADAILAQLEGPESDLAWEVVLFEHRSANAFALPGGKVGVHTGIFRVARDQDTLAAVIAHEVAHVLAEDSLKRARRQIRNRLLVIGAAGVLGGGSDALGIGAEIGLSRPYDRQQETRADEEGLRLMARAGFDPRAGMRLWKNMARHNPAEPPRFLSTHPSTGDRIDRMIRQLTPSLVLYNEAREKGHEPMCEPR